MNARTKIWLGALCATALLALPGAAGEVDINRDYSIKALRNDDHYITHVAGLGRIGRIRSERDAKSARFRIVRGMAGRCWSFEALYPRGHYLRHANFQIVLSKRINERQFNEDATFCGEWGMAGDMPTQRSVTFRSLNFPDRMIRHRNFELWLDVAQNDPQFKRDASFYVVGTVDYGTLLNDQAWDPVDE